MSEEFYDKISSASGVIYEDEEVKATFGPASDGDSVDSDSSVIAVTGSHAPLSPCLFTLGFLKSIVQKSEERLSGING